MKKAMLLLYRVVYGAFSALILAIAVTQVIRYSDVMAKSQTLLLSLFACAAAFMLFATFVFRRLTVPLLWTGTVVLCGLFAWYGWYSLAAPFVQHETHTFDPVQAAAESSKFRMQSAVTFAIIVAWFATLPVVRQFLTRTGGGDSSTP